MRNQIIIIFISLINLFSCSLSQKNITSTEKSTIEFDRGSSKVISKVDFDTLVEKSIILLETKTLEEITDAQHIDIMMCLNTAGMQSLKNEKYRKLELVSEQKGYAKNIIKRYPKWIPNRGMGFYFPKLNMEVYGTPRAYAIFEIKK